MNKKSQAPALAPAGATSLDQHHAASFAVFGFEDILLETLAKEGFSTPTPIQAMAIPPLLEGRDLVGLAQTGTGKTAAFLLPLISHLMAGEPVRPGQPPRALILAPTRELANQLRDNIRKLAINLNLRHLAVFGGARYDEQIRGLRQGVDIVVATPGRLEDLMKRQVIQLDAITHFVLDEADHMLDLGFYPAMKRISAALPRGHQTMLFSATMPPEIKKLTAEFLANPVEIRAPQSGHIADKINQRAMIIPEKEKPEALATFLQQRAGEQVLVFVRTKRRADMLARAMATRGFAIDALHGDMNQRIRQKVLNKFRHGELTALIATDVAARGIDVAGISLVLNYDLSDTPEAYVHRIGRTGRAGLAGLAVSFAGPDEMRKLRPILDVAGARMEVTDAEGRPLDVLPGGGANTRRNSRPPFRQRPNQAAGHRAGKPWAKDGQAGPGQNRKFRKDEKPSWKKRNIQDQDETRSAGDDRPQRAKPPARNEPSAKPTKTGKAKPFRAATQHGGKSGNLEGRPGKKGKPAGRAGKSGDKRGKPGKPTQQRGKPGKPARPTGKPGGFGGLKRAGKPKRS